MTYISKIRCEVIKKYHYFCTMKCLFLNIALILGCMGAKAQQIRTFVPNIVTPRLLPADEVEGLPILKLQGGEQLEFSFDDLDTNYERYVYRIEHCDQHFKPTQGLLESSYLQATENTLPIDNYVPSRNTTTNFNHYSLRLPNEDMRMLLPGNYRLSVMREAEDADAEELETVAESFFMVGEQRVGIQATMTTMTDADYNNRHQQLTLEVDFSTLRLSRPEEELSVYVVKNRRWDDIRRCPAPTFLTGNKMKWQHCRNLIFNAGNEFRKFETLSTEYPTMHVDHMGWNAERNSYVATLYTDEVRKNYLYDEDLTGGFIIRNTDNYDNDTESDYIDVHFCLDAPLRLDCPIYVYGEWATNADRETYRMHYNEEANLYESTIKLKQGYYNYYYDTPDDSVEGNFYQTKNEYLILVYARPFGARYDSLVGWKVVK